MVVNPHWASFLILRSKTIFTAFAFARDAQKVQVLGLRQCDQMVRLFLNIWPFAIVKISPIMSQICQSQLSILPNMKWTVKNLPKTGKLLPKWRNIAKSGHTTFRRLRRRIVSSETKWNFPLNLKPKNVRFSATFFLFSKFKKSRLDRIAILVNLIKHFTIVIYDSRVVLAINLSILQL